MLSQTVGNGPIACSDAAHRGVADSAEVRDLWAGVEHARARRSPARRRGPRTAPATSTRTRRAHRGRERRRLGRVVPAVDVNVGENVYLNTWDYGAYTAAVFTVPVTTSVPRTSIHVDALVRVHDASSVMDRARYAWGWGTPVLETDAWAFIVGAIARSVFTRIESASPSDNHLEERITGQDQHLVGAWTPEGGIPTGTHTITIELRQGVQAGTKGGFRSRLEATLAYVTVTER